MSNVNIEKLLVAQAIDKKRLQLLHDLENGKVKTELDKAKKIVEKSKANLLKLEEDAKRLQENYQRIAKLVADALVQIEQANTKKSEDLELYSNYLSKLSILEGQLSEIENQIGQKTMIYKNTFNEVKKATLASKNLTKLYEDAKNAESPKIQALEQEFAEKTKGIDEKLLAKYHAVRDRKVNDVKDVVVPLTGNCCPGCGMEVPGAMVNKIQTEGWATCEGSGCERIIYQA